MKRSGTADLPLHYGQVPLWLSERMAKLGFAIVETIAMEFSTSEVISKLSNPFWFQSFGAVMGMDWHSSGITTSVLGALKKSVNPHSKELGIYICGGKGKHSLLTPQELLFVGEKTGLDGSNLANCSKLTAKVDNTAIQDGFQLYQHNFIVDNKGQWAVIQQGMNPDSKTARRYHWHSQDLKSFINEPHTFIYGENQGTILNLTAQAAEKSREGILELSKESPAKIMKEMQYLSMPAHHDVRMEDVNMKRLGAMLWTTHENRPEDFQELLLLKGMGPRALQSLALVSEIIYGTPTRFEDPARFSFAHGGKDGHPFPVPVKIYDETIDTLQRAINRAKIGNSDKIDAIKKLSEISRKAEESFTPNDNFDALIQKERDESYKYGGRTIFGDAKPPKNKPSNPNNQLELF
ncbi:DUF763 domain-containing protein [Flavobacterium sp. WLB]|uniref:DUF763 domain-containing protein n=1 Tax=unclassified Flavobacterium TaxID=196869 RepID=UPI0006ABC88C|nr:MULTISPECIES: DUF763 domain-containing protein [unclassified Flavobacterium]KOP39786.1 hypothetical protein AKO67_02575 [Flavobacterium sp. VMW]OWU92572.1 hypothetical protein APR43_00485 [Flavobacterium sp. NLM]PUU69251.1 DUF763 domain-containing protein [Flavobacterium sp. WLB]